MAFATIDKPASYFNTKLYTGNGSATQAITGVNFQPDFVWIKDRVEVYDHHLFDAVRGGGNSLYSNDTVVENTYTTDISFNSDGFTTAGVGGAAINYINQNGHTFASWNWKANGTGSSNTSGTITSTVSANTTSGFSIVSYTGNGTNGATIGHGLGVSPKMVIVKSRSNTGDWAVYHASLTAGNMVFLNTTGASGTISGFDNGGINPVSSTTFTTAQGGVSQNNVNTSGRTYIAYCFADVKGFSKMGSWVGNGSTDGTFVYTGFKPSFIMIKNSNVGGTGWSMWDSKRNTYNLVNTYLQANSATSEGTQAFADFLSNGIKIRDSNSFCNGSGNTIVYMAFAENPFTSSKGIPCTAR